MRTWLKVAIAVLCSAYALLAHADFKSDFLKQFPSSQGAKFSRAFPGFWAVAKGDEIFFVNDDLSILISGNVFDLKSHRSISDEIREANRPKMDIKQLDLRDAIKLSDGSRKLYVFSDPDCPYCRRLDPELGQLKDVAIYLFPFPLAQLHPNAPGVAEAIWCQKDRAAAWNKYQDLAREAFAALAAQPSSGPLPVDQEADYKARTASLMSSWHDYLHTLRQPDQPTCENPIERNLAFGKVWSINGTPALFFQDGTLIPGAVSVTRIEAQLEKSSAAPVGANK